MRPILLQMAAFGPFAKHEEIDFTKLGKNPLFLINGPTGSGKSTILDAICFALYGETTGNDREAKQMRSDHADPSTLTKVTLIFELGSGVFKISRTPEQYRPKARGDGFTEQKAVAELHRVEGDQHILLVAPKVTEATAEIVKLTGLSAAQFRQVMVLPQGKFRDLLLAKSEDRERIFQQLFQTHIYSMLQTKLRDQSNALTTNIKALQQQQDAILDVFTLESGGHLNEEIKQIKKEMKAIFKNKEMAGNSLKQLQSAFQKAEILEHTFIEYDNAVADNLKLKERVGEIEANKKRLNRTLKANEIAPDFHNKEKSSLLLKNAQKKVRKSHEADRLADSAQLAINAEKSKLPNEEDKVEKVTAKIKELENYRQRSQQLKISIAAFEKNEIRQKNIQSGILKQQKHLFEMKETLEDFRAELHKKTQIVSTLSEKMANLELLETQGKSLRKISEIETAYNAGKKHVEQIERKVSTKEESVLKKNRELLIYEQAWQSGQAAILAEGLNDGSACPVCGSQHHPNVAEAEGALPTEIDLNRLRKEENTLRDALEKITREKLLGTEQNKQLLVSLDEEKSKKIANTGLSLENMREKFQICRDDIIDVKKIAEEIPKIELKVQNLIKQVSQAEEGLAVAHTSAIAINTDFSTTLADVNNKKAELPERFRTANILEISIKDALAEQSTLKARIEDVKTRYQKARETKISSESALNFNISQEKLIGNELGDISDSWIKRLENSIFISEADFLSAILPSEVELNLVNTIRQFEDEKLLSENQIIRKKTDIDGKTRPNLDVLAVGVTKETNDVHALNSDYHKLEQRKIALDKASNKLKNASNQQATLEREFGVIGKLSDISNGKNPHNLSLQRFVLSVLLDDVLLEASHRLLKMSKGRYQLYRKDTVGDKRLKAGLDLVVEDAYTGKQRAAATLSGGESFIAALALALGLSDVVQAYAGGIRLDTLFIDEGFGSLDPESLELAINTLLDLRASGRMVGVISHVEEMKRIIDVRLDIITNKEISHTRVVGV